MSDFAGLTEEEIGELCDELEGQLEAGICDESVCAAALALVRAIPSLLVSYDLTRHRLKVCRAQLRLVRKAKAG
jgi:hypothetical protein